MYIAIFPFRTFDDTSNEQIAKNIQSIKKDIRSYSTNDKRVILDNAPKAQDKKDNLFNIFMNVKRYNASSPLHVGFYPDRRT